MIEFAIVVFVLITLLYGIIACVSTKEHCHSNTCAECLKVTVINNYASGPLFPEPPGLGIITPSTISSTDVVQLGSAK
jgi:hypothetical protein